MYANSSELIAGYEKSQWRAFGNVFGAIATAIFLFLSSIYPIIILPLDLKTGLGLYLLILLSRFLSAIKTNSVKWTAPLHPLAIAIWIYLIFRSINRKRLNSLYWRGRQI
jgi:Ca2+/Na+ antiporter